MGKLYFAACFLPYLLAQWYPFSAKADNKSAVLIMEFITLFAN